MPSAAQPGNTQRSGPLDVQAYADELRTLADEIRQTDVAGIADLQRRVPAVWHVERDGRTIEVPGLWLQRWLIAGSRDPGQWPAIRSELAGALVAAEREALAQVANPAPADSDRIRASLDEVLARPEFSRIERDNAIARLQARILEWLRQWWARLGGDRLANRSAATVFAWIATLAAVAVLAGWLIHTLRGAGRRSRTLPDAPARTRVPAHVWARRALDADDPREAVRCAWRAVISRFEEDGTWRTDDARTPREYLRLLPSDHARRPVLQDVARRFEEVWFGGRAATDADRGALRGRLEELGCLTTE